MGVVVRSREERQMARVQRAARKADRKRRRFAAFGNRIAPQLMAMTPEERRKLIEENPGMFRGGGNA